MKTYPTLFLWALSLLVFTCSISANFLSTEGYAFHKYADFKNAKGETVLTLEYGLRSEGRVFGLLTI